jgi:zinc/manganese transport system permease protein
MLYDFLIAPFADFAFMRRALVGSMVLATGAAPVGVFLMLRRMSLTGDAMAHAILPGAAIGFLVAGLSLPAMTLGGLVAGIAVAMLAGLVARTTVLREDASLAAFYLVSLALGVVLVSLRGSNVDLMNVLFGTVLALDDEALLLLAGVTTVTLVALAALYRPLVLECFDPNFLRSVSGAGAPTHFVFLGLVVLNLVAGFQALGTLLAVGIMMLPAVAARFWTNELGPLIGLSVAFGLGGSWLGLLVSYHAGVPSGPAIILACGAIVVVSLIAGSVGGLAARLVPRRHLEA